MELTVKIYLWTNKMSYADIKFSLFTGIFDHGVLI